MKFLRFRAALGLPRKLVSFVAAGNRGSLRAIRRILERELATSRGGLNPKRMVLVREIAQHCLDGQRRGGFAEVIGMQSLALLRQLAREQLERLRVATQEVNGPTGGAIEQGQVGSKASWG
ncbi:hypothetical protein HHK36_002231 [Tetracentron sinense]|uniref:Uncharacterized protein n=1 Tax=Tetracentron sinense TaxID=13715 RepID=A0A835A461_TETSI|nr:hypothetical protein HHK36_002231 [Tetracentron sinense]